MNSYPSFKPKLSLAALWAVGCTVWVLAADPAESSEAKRQIILAVEVQSSAPGLDLAEGCPYPPETPASQGLLEGFPEANPKVKPPANGPIRPAVFYELLVPMGTAEYPVHKI